MGITIGKGVQTAQTGLPAHSSPADARIVFGRMPMLSIVSLIVGHELSQ
jgi:hypothetical protein